MIHTLVYDDDAGGGGAGGGSAGGGGGGGGGAREVEVVMATREYRIIGKVSSEAIEALRASSGGGDGGAAVADPEARIHTVAISCPEGLPVDLFLENVLSLVRRALRQAEPGAAPMSRGPSDEYGWRDRGWERGGAQFERTLAEKLRDGGVAPVARRQTAAEAETLVKRLQGMMMVSVEVEAPSASSGGGGGGGGGEGEDGADRFPPLSRVQGLVASESAAAFNAACGAVGNGGAGGERSSNNGESGDAAGRDGAPAAAQWTAATVVETSAGGISLVYDDGVFEASVPPYRVRPVPQPEVKHRLNPLAAIFMSFEQFLSSREERRAEYELNGRDSQPANLRRSFSAFHIGRVQQVGRVPRDALDAPPGGGGEADPSSAPTSAAAALLSSSSSVGGGAKQLASAATTPTGRVTRSRSKSSSAAGGGGGDAMDTSPIEPSPPSGGGGGGGGGGAMAIAPLEIAPMRLRVRFALGTETEAPEALAACGKRFEETSTLLHCLEMLRESTDTGRRAAAEPQALGYHPGVTCDRTGMNPITGNRYKLRGENYDVCEAEYLKMAPDERGLYARIPPPVFRKPKGNGPAKWHLYYWAEVTDGGAAGGADGERDDGGIIAAGERGGGVGGGVVGGGGGGVGGVGGAADAASGGSPKAAAGGSDLLAWSAREVESGLLSGRLEPEIVLRELRRAVPGSELRLSEAATRVLTGSYGTALAPMCSAQLMSVFREVSGTPRARGRVGADPVARGARMLP